MAETKRDLNEIIRANIKTYKDNLLSGGIYIYDLLLSTSKIVVDGLNFKEERDKIRVDLQKDLNYLIGSPDATESFITNVCDQIRGVNKSFIKVRDTLKDNKFAQVVFEKFKIDQLIREGEMLLSELGSLQSESLTEDIALGILKNMAPPLYGVFVVGREIGKALPILGKEAKKFGGDIAKDLKDLKAAWMGEGKYKPQGGPGRGSTARPAPGITPSLGGIPKEPTEPPEQATTAFPRSSIAEKSIASSIVSPAAPQASIGKSVAAPTTNPLPTKMPQPFIVGTPTIKAPMAESFMREGRLYQPQRNESGQFTGGGFRKDAPDVMQQERNKNVLLAEREEEESFHDALYKFFSKSAYDAKWTSELLDTIKGIAPKGETPGKSKLSIADLMGAVNAIGKVIGAVGRVVGGIGQAIGKIAVSVGSKIGGALSDAAVASTAIGTAAIGGAAVMGGMLNNAWTEETINTTKLADANDAYAFQEFLKVNNMNRKKKGLAPVGAQSRISNEDMAGASEAPSTTKPLKRVPSDNFIAENQKSLTAVGFDKLYAVMLEISNSLKDAGKTGSQKKPSGYDANNTRNPVLSSLGAGQLDIS